MQNFVRQWTKKSTGQCVRWFEKSTGQFKKPPAFVRFPVLNTIPENVRLICGRRFPLQPACYCIGPILDDRLKEKFLKP